MKKIVVVILCCVVLSTGFGLILSGVISYPQGGICFGMCEQDRREKFNRIFPEWFSRESECGPRIPEDRELIMSLYPDLLPDIDTKNQSFAALSVREQNGVLSLGERDDYLDDPWRVIWMAQKEYVPGSFSSEFSEELPYEDHSTWVRQCPQNGLIGDSYCEDFVSVFFITRANQTGYFGNIHLNERAYSQLNETGEIDSFITRIELDTRRDFNLRRSAENVVQAMPATDFPLEGSPFYELTIKNRVEQVYLESKCP